MEIGTYSTMNIQCPNCGHDLAGELESLCEEPYNGTLEICGDCEAELSLEMKVEIMVINTPSKG